MDPTLRFSSRVSDYVRYRPSYPPKIVNVLVHQYGLTTRSPIADIGSGTGLLSEVFLQNGNPVYCVEPNPEMREAGKQYLAPYSGALSIAGAAESTTLPAASVEFVTAGQAFHWFDPPRAREEFHRILRPGGHAVLVWNERSASATPFLGDLEHLLNKYAPEYQHVDHRHVDSAVLNRFFGHSAWHTHKVPNQQSFNLEGLKGRIRSASYTPLPDTPLFTPLMEALERAFRDHQAHGQVLFLYETVMHVGTLPGLRA